VSRKRYAHVGVGGRSEMFTTAIAETYKDVAELVGLCDINLGRAELRHNELAHKGLEVPVYHADAFDRMVAEQKPDTVIVTTKDCLHDAYICRAMDLGCDAITEKPMTTDENKCQRIVDAIARTGKHLRVTFNYRYSPPHTQIRRLLRSGLIGDVLSVDYAWNLNTSHGADYYRRWHRNKANSGGLLVHKATHHFDLANWWIGSTPDTVCALGRRAFYVPATADGFGLDRRTERCHTCPHMPDGTCRFALDLAGNEELKRLYLDQEHHDGYFRDRCVFSADIDIEDSMNLVVRYRNGVHMSYCLNSFLPWEGLRIMFNGVRGRIEYQIVESTYISGDGTVPGETVKEECHIHVFPHFETPYSIELETGKGGHGGGDVRLLDHVFGVKTEDPDGHAAGVADGCWSILTGVAANHSMARGGHPVRLADLVTGIPDPNFVA